MKGRVLVIDDEEGIRFTLSKFLENDDYETAGAESYGDAMALIEANEYDAVFADITLGGRSGIDLLRDLRNSGFNSPVIMITGSPAIETASEAVRLGAFDYIPKPFTKDQILRLAGIALRHKRLSDENEKFRSNLEAVFRSVNDGIVAVDMDMRITAFNDSYKSLCGTDSEFIGKPLASAWTACSNICIDMMAQALREGETVERFRVECARNPIVVNLTASPLVGSSGEAMGAVMVIRNKTRTATLEQCYAVRKEYAGMIGASDEIRKIYSLIDDLADIGSTVLITGETGTGKELVAGALHHEGIRRGKPFIKVNCSAIAENLLESELFGHVKGAFTGAVMDKAGRFESANGGTIFLDEIGDISPRMQLRLLRVLQEKEFERVGGTRTTKVDVRVVAATNRDLRARVEEGAFREDLYYRLNVVQVRIPSLRERREDIPLLVEHFISKFRDQLSRNVHGVSRDVMEIFMQHPWPGNIRQLEHVIEHAVIQAREEVIARANLPEDLDLSTPSSKEMAKDDPQEAESLRQALEKTGWNKAKAARLLGISRQTIYRKISENRIEQEK